jgi:hypothetical protein
VERTGQKHRATINHRSGLPLTKTLVVMMNRLEYLTDALRRLEQEYLTMGRSVPAPVPVMHHGIPFFRHKKQTDILLCFLKGVKLTSTLNAALLLFRHGYAQELGALARIADDLLNDILFMLKPLDGGKPSKDQLRFFEEFFQEEFENPMNVLAGAQKRDIVSRRKLHATFGHLAKESFNPSDAQNMMSTIHAALSGYVHGAYPHIMELYGGNPPHFHMSGLPGTPRIAEWDRQLITYAYRGIMVSGLVARKLGLTDSENALRVLMEEFEATLDCKADADVEAQVRAMKEGAKRDS